MFTITKAQLRVSAVNVGHLQVVHEEVINNLFQRVWGVYSFTHPNPQTVNSPHTLVLLIDKILMYNLKMTNIDGQNMYLCLSNSKHTTKNIVVFVTIYICTI